MRSERSAILNISCLLTSADSHRHKIISISDRMKHKGKLFRLIIHLHYLAMRDLLAMRKQLAIWELLAMKELNYR